MSEVLERSENFDNGASHPNTILLFITIYFIKRMNVYDERYCNLL